MKNEAHASPVSAVTRHFSDYCNKIVGINRPATVCELTPFWPFFHDAHTPGSGKKPEAVWPPFSQPAQCGDGFLFFFR